MNNAPSIFTYILSLGLLALSAQAQTEICDNGLDDDGDQLIDCFDPDCCTSCEDHYFFDCDTSCDALQLKDSIVLRTLWRFANEGWDRRNTPLVGTLQGSSVSIVGLSDFQASSISNRNLLVVNGEDGSLSNTIMTPSISNYAQSIGIADIDKNGVGDIIVGVSNEAADARKVFRFRPDGTILWRSDEQYGYADNDVNLSPQFADFDEDGRTEIYFGSQIFNSANGDLICQGGDSNNYGRQTARNPLYIFYASTAADVLPDGYCSNCEGLELVAGNQVFSVDIASGSMTVVSEQGTSEFRDGLTALADMNGDDALDIIVAQRIGDFVNIWVWDPISGNLLSRYIHPATVPTSFTGGSSVPLCTDIDLDGDVDVIFSTSQMLVALANDGNGALSPAWTIPTNDISGRSGPVAFDFDGNGLPEIVHRGADFLRVISSLDGKVLDSVDCYSPTFFDKAIVANVDSDPGAEIICSCGNELRAYTTGYSQWAPARPVWNQMNYYNTHIRDDLTVPQYMQSSPYPELNGRKPLNRYLEQYSQPDKPTSDLFFERIRIICADGRRMFSARICNDGDVRAPANIFLSIYSMAPTTSSDPPIWTDSLPDDFPIGACRSYVFDIPDSIDSDTIFFGLNIRPNATTVDTLDPEDFVAVECTYHNNIEAFDMRPYIEASVSLPADTLLCPGQILILDPGNYFQYVWSDASTNETLRVEMAGIYSVTVTDECGNRASDTVNIEYVQLPALGLGQDTSVCPGDTLEFTGSPVYDSIAWSFRGTVICTNCIEISLPVLDSGMLRVEAHNGPCRVDDSVVLNVLSTPIGWDTLLICPGDSAIVFGDFVGEGIYSETFDRQGLCDSVSRVAVILREDISYEVNTDTICNGNEKANISINGLSPGLRIEWEDGNDQWERSDLGVGIHSFRLTGSQGCELEDSIEIVRHEDPIESLIINPPICNEENGRIELRLKYDSALILLEGDSIGIGSAIVNNLGPGLYDVSFFYKDCREDTLINFQRNDFDSLLQDEEIDIVLGDSVLLGEELISIFNEAVWTPSTGLACDSCLPVLVYPSNDIIYTVRGIGAGGCEIEKTYRLTVDRRSIFFIPNIFSPNGDGINDQFVFHARLKLESVDQFILYDRWGSLITERKGLMGQEVVLWDGTFKGNPAPQGVYVFYIRFTDAGGRTFEIGGDVTLIR